MSATILVGVLDWLRLRADLAAYRIQAGLDETELAEIISVAKTTIYRAEDTEGSPDKTLDLETIDAWLRATKGPSLSDFFADLERPQNSALKRDRPGDTTADPEPQRIEVAHRGGPVPAADSPSFALSLAYIQQFHDALAKVIAAAVPSEEDHRSVSNTGPNEAAGGQVAD